MESFAFPLTGRATPDQAFRWLADRALRRGLPAPAGLIGDWFHGRAVLAPSVSVEPTPWSALGEVAPAAGAVVGGGWFGYLGFPGQRRRLPESAWGWADHVLRLDADGRWWFEALREPPPELVAEVAQAVSSPQPSATRWRIDRLTRPDADAHRKAVRRCIEEIAAGEVFQTNICTRFEANVAGDPLAVFAEGCRTLAPARAACVSGSWGCVASLSPELFLARHDETVRSGPIKGTLPRRGPEDDDNARLLRASVKDIAENVMITDMARNDLGRVAEIGSVTVPELLAVQPHPGVWHLVSEVLATVARRVSHAELLHATFPPASVTGAPKPRALEIIDSLETRPRDVYCGAVGLVSPLAGLELNVAIRTLEWSGDAVHLGVGGGITADSDPEREWQECLTKAAPLLGLLGQPVP